MKQFKGYGRKEQRVYEVLPKGAYVIKILDAKEEPNRNGSGTHLKVSFDIAEGEYAGFYMAAFQNDTREDKKWSNDAVIYITCPDDNSEQYVVDNFNAFMTAVEDSNEGYHWNWEEGTLKGKLVGAKFRNEQSEYNGKVYDHVKPKWFIKAQAVRDGKFGKLPNDVLIEKKPAADFVNVPEVGPEEIPF